ncbi:receptor-type guanylate cyclase Gyc76C [Agrilus planipennis]|uniref:Guanylate cyclase n=1 Tax=Agrilus planipennis TaxID=224129 RepID=A0A1W4XT11_AGRPL|nr:receptor-type guanylate cyclase Gyc76C [Agrilus planipennis]
MRLGPALLVALLLPLIARAVLSNTSLKNESAPSSEFGAPSGFNTISSHSAPKSSSGFSKTPNPVNSIPFTDKQNVLHIRGGNVTSNWSKSFDDDGLDIRYQNVSNNTNKPSLTVESLKVAPLYKKKNITVGYLTAAKGDLKERQGLLISGAFTMALEEINNDPNLLPNVTLVYRWYDTRGDTVLATRAMTDMICDGVTAFFGPEGSCHVEAIVAQSRNIPMISYKCSDHTASSVPTFARTEPPNTQVTKSVIALLSYYGWQKFSIIYDQAWETVAESLVDQAVKKNMTINVKKSVGDNHECCERKLPCCSSSYWYQFIQDTKNRTRIYIFLGTSMALIDLMNTMQTAQLFDKGEYMVIYVDMNTYSSKEALKYLWKPETFTKYSNCISHQKDFLKRGRSLLVVVSTQPSQNFQEFANRVNEYNKREPFGFDVPDKFALRNYSKHVSIYAAYLYDSVKLYAKALHKLLSEEKILNDSIIEEIASNGTRIIQTIIESGTYQSITGATMRLDKNGDSEGNFSVLALKKVPDSQSHVRSNFTCHFQMVPVGQFQQGDFPKYKINRQIDWPGGVKPDDEPSCGFNNEMCPKNDTHLNSIIAAGTLAIMLFCAGVITMSIYRKWKIEQEIEGLLWKIDPNEIRDYYEHDIVQSPSKASLYSASATSFESHGGAQVFATTATYRGVIVRIKELSFSRKKDISRDVMKEMRLLRELRHDNINSFIGACVEPMALLLVTDYCAKGSLYDIIENEDIKLDKMFIASLVHDLIKGMLYIHNSMLICHGNLKSSNCVVTSRWVLQVTDFGLAEMRACAENDSIGEHQYYRSLFWKAPEILRNPQGYIRGTQKGDVYAFAIILYEIIGRKGPFGATGYEPKEIIEFVKNSGENCDEPFRPNLDALLDTEMGREDYVLQCVKDCWAENPDNRPDFASVRGRLKRMKDGKNRNIMDQMMDMMEKYANNLEDLVTERTRLLDEEKKKTEDLLHRMLPKPVANRLTMGYGVEPESFDQVTIYFSDIVGFTSMSAESTPLQVVNFLNDLYTVFDRIIKGYDVYKVETIGDAYMVVSGLPLRNGDKHAGEIASMSLDLLNAVRNYSIAHRPKDTLKLRIGIHTGPVVAGVVGLTMPRYCLFGDTVNTASRMESNGEPLKIHISVQCKEALEKLGGYVVEERGQVYMKGKGEVLTYWLLGATDKAIQRREVDIGDLPPLFCRPRKSPKLNNESRQASICGALGFSGFGSRRHSSVPRGTSIDSTSTVHNASPVPSRFSSFKASNRLALQVPDSGSRLTINSAISQAFENVEQLGGRRGIRPRRVLSSIASSCDEPVKSQGFLNKIRESRSLDPLPLVKTKQKELSSQFIEALRRSTRSLENCDKYGEVQIIAIPEDRLVNNNFPNGNVLNPQQQEEDFCLKEDVKEPLLQSNPNTTILHRRKANDAGNEQLQKKWRSLETVPASGDQISADNNKKKLLPKNSIRTWLAGIFNGNGLRSSNASLGKAVMPDYNNLQAEKESIV